MGRASRPVWGAWIEIGTKKSSGDSSAGRAPYGARGLKYAELGLFWCAVQGRAPYGARGLKSCFSILFGKISRSRPVWGAWIEIACKRCPGGFCGGRAPYGARGLKCCIAQNWRSFLWRRAPYGARGLKFQSLGIPRACDESRPVWGAWIEIPLIKRITRAKQVAPRMGRVD